MNVGSSEALLFANDADWSRAQAELSGADFGDGLPLVVPTRQRMEAMLSEVGDAGRVLGQMPPLLGDLTIEGIAYCCVLAGCVPAELPVVVAASIATLEPEFNLLGILTTTGTPAVCLVVHGPIIAELGMNAGANCLGSGNRANACIGRALQLVHRNIGGALPGLSDMATMGQPGKYVFCFAESVSAIIPPLAGRRGLDPEANAVTVIGVSGTLEILPHNPADSAETVLMPVVQAMHGARLAQDAAMNRPASEQFILIPPEMAELVHSSGWDVAAMQDFILRNSPAGVRGESWPLAPSARDIVIISTGGAGIKMTCLVPWGGASRSVTRPLGH